MYNVINYNHYLNNMETKFTGSNYYKRSFTEYEIEANERDAAKRAQECAESDAEIQSLEAEIAAVKQRNADALAGKNAEITALESEIAAAKTKRNHKLAAMDAEIAALEAELAAAKTKRTGCCECKGKDADIAAYQTLPYTSF